MRISKNIIIIFCKNFVIKMNKRILIEFRKNGEMEKNENVFNEMRTEKFQNVPATHPKELLRIHR